MEKLQNLSSNYCSFPYIGTGMILILIIGSCASIKAFHKRHQISEPGDSIRKTLKIYFVLFIVALIIAILFILLTLLIEDNLFFAHFFGILTSMFFGIIIPGSTILQNEAKKIYYIKSVVKMRNKIFPWMEEPIQILTPSISYISRRLSENISIHAVFEEMEPNIFPSTSKSLNVSENQIIQHI